MSQLAKPLRFTVEDRGGRTRTFVGLMAPDSDFVDGGRDRLLDILSTEASVDILYADNLLVPVDDAPAAGRVEMRASWSPDRLLSGYDLGPLIVARESVLDGLAPTRHHELALVAATSARKVVHVPEALTTRSGESFVDVDGDALTAYLSESGAPIWLDRVGTDSRNTVGAIVEPGRAPQPFASLIVLTGGARRSLAGVDVLLIANAVASVLVATERKDFEIVVVLDSKAPPMLGELIRSLDPDRVVVVADDRPFNFSAANNLGVESSKGEHLVFLNDDCEIVAGDWLARISMHLESPGVGIVGARLLYGDGRVQHAGLVARGGFIEHRFGGYPDDERSRPAWIENVSAVTGACLGITRALFDELGGFPEEFPLNFNDVHLCFAAADAGRRVVLDHRIVLTHHETSSREPGITETEQRAFEARWPHRSHVDPYDHPSYLPVRSQPIAPPAALLRLRAALGIAPPQPRVST